MGYTYYEIAVLFFVYSFLAWLAETVIATAKEKDFKNRGFASGPFCFIYGLTGIVLTVFLRELKDDAVFLFLGSMAVGTLAEWITGKALERMKQKKWWDYSGKRWNFDGYICLQYSLLWGLMGFLAVRFGNGLILRVFRGLPGIVGKTAVLALTVIGLLDLAGSWMSVYHMEKKLPRLFGWSQRLQKWTYRFAKKVTGRVERRIGNAYPAIGRKEAAGEEKSTEKCSFVQLFWLFLIGAFLGDIVETVFCRITMGEWMSRSSLVWGPFSVVWGLAMAIATALLYKDRDREEHHIFWVGTFLGGAYEYVCSVFTEIVFGKVFWDYSEMPFNLGGRINLLYCFFWGIAAIVWIKGIYPEMSRLIDKIVRKTGRILTGVLLVFMVCNICVSMMALVRYDTRAHGKKAEYGWERAMDEHFGNERMKRIYPNAKEQ